MLLTYLWERERERERDEIIIIHKFKGESQSLLVVDTYFHDTFFYKPDSYIVLYIFSSQHDSSLCEYIGEIEGVWFRGNGLVPFRPFA